MCLEQQYRMIVESLQLVAAPSDEQVSALPDFVVVTDEIANTFEDAFLLVPNFDGAGYLNEEVTARLKRLDAWFAAAPHDGSVAPTESLETHDFWETARMLAREALESMNEERRPPDLGHVFWTQ